MRCRSGWIWSGSALLALTIACNSALSQSSAFVKSPSLSACTGNLSDAVSIMKVPGNLPSGMWPQQRQSIATLDSKIITAWDTYLNPVPAGAGPYWPKVDTRLTFVDAATGQRTRPDVVFNTNPL